MSALNSAARNKPKLIRGSLSDLLPRLYKETIVNKDLIRTVQMGPWTHKVDDGLEARKTAFETMYTLVRLSLPFFSLPGEYTMSDTCLHLGSSTHASPRSTCTNSSLA